MKIGRLIAKYRRAAGYTQAELGTRVGLAVTIISNYECDERQPSLRNAVRIATALHVSLDKLAGLDPSNSRA